MIFTLAYCFNSSILKYVSKDSGKYISEYN